MAAVSVPWVVENGAQVGAEVGRVLANVATSNAQGVSLPGDLTVAATATVSGQVQIASGGVVVLNQQAAGESYIGAFRGTTTVNIDPTTGASRTDLIVARIVDPDFSPWQTSDVPDPVNGPYLQAHVIKGVSSFTTRASDVVTYAAVELARVTIPANTSNITNAMITDLRSLVQPRSRRNVRGLNNQEQYTFFYEDTDWHDWPLPATFGIYIPPWATHVVWSVALGQIIPVYTSGFTTGLFRLNIGDTILSDSVQWEVDAGNSTNPQHILNADEYALPLALRGTTVTFKLQAKRTAGTSAIRWHPVSSLALDVTFEERIV